MAKLAIKGHETKCDEVIEILGILGGSNAFGHIGNNPRAIYYIDETYKNFITCSETKKVCDCVIFTLEEFLEKYPYKVGDKVRIPEYESEVPILSMNWNGYEVQYEVFTDETEWYSAKELNEYNEPNKEETMEEKGILTIDFTKDTRIADKVEVILGDYEFVLKDGKTYFVKKKPKYPKTYEECCKVLGINELPYMAYTWNRNEDVEVILQEHQISTILNLDRFRKLLVCRDAYWKLERDWKPDWLYDDTKYILHINSLDICKDMSKHSNYILAFPTEEMRDAFYKNFKELIEECKELL